MPLTASEAPFVAQESTEYSVLISTKPNSQDDLRLLGPKIGQGHCPLTCKFSR